MSFYRHSQSGSQYQNHPGPDQPGHFLMTKPLRFLHPSVMSNMLHSPRICIHASFAVVPLLLPSCGIIMRWLVRKAYRKSQLTLRFLFCLLLGSNNVVILLTLFQVFPARVFQAIRPLPLMLEAFYYGPVDCPHFYCSAVDCSCIYRSAVNCSHFY